MRRRKQLSTLKRLHRKVVNTTMEEETETEAQEATPRTAYRRRPYSESYRQLYALRQDLLNKTRQLEQSLDTIILYVRDLLR